MMTADDTKDLSTASSAENAVRQIFADATRYPLEILEPTAHLEDELGIDSVKRAEILIALQKKFGLPPDLKVPPESLTTIRDIAGAISSFINSGADRQSSPSVYMEEIPINPAADRPGQGDANLQTRVPHKQEDIEKIILSIFAESTRYPLEILETSAHLEDDLGIDSVKRAEILIAVQKKFGLPSDFKVPPESLTTIKEIAKTISVFLGHSADIGSSASSKQIPEIVDSRPRSTVGTRSYSQEKKSPWDNGSLMPTGYQPFKGKVALVTGSGHGIGRVIARQLASLGASIVVNTFHSRALGDEVAQGINKEGGDAIHLWGSVANQKQFNKIFDEIDERFGRLDFFVSNASNGIISPLPNITDEQWTRAFQTNVIGLHQGALHARDLMKRNGGGKIITLSSPGAHRHIHHFGCLGPIKAAVESLTLYLAIEFAGDNIQVNCISIGPVYGELLSKYPDSDQLIPHWESLAAKNRLIEEDDVADVVTYLLSSGSNKITGSVLLLDGGGSKQI